MDSHSSSVCDESQTRCNGKIRITILAVTCLTGVLYLWTSGCYYTLLIALLSISSYGYICGLEFFPRGKSKVRSRSFKDTEVVLVTGCDTGLGYSLALHLRSIGIRVIAGVHHRESRGAIELSTKDRIFVHPLDLTSCESVKFFNNAVCDYLKRENLVLRAFVNNAGAMIFGEFEWQTEQQMRHQIEVNVLGTMRITREFLPIIRDNSARIIVVTSHCASEPLPGVAIYGATKAALAAWSTGIRVELKKYGVEVVTFVPGSFIRESNLLSQQKMHFEEMESAMSEKTRCFYGDYFTTYANYLSNLAPSDLPQKLTNPLVYKIFESALCDRHPRANYKCEPWRYMMYHILFKIAPTSMRDRLVDSFMQLPAWKYEKTSSVENSR